MTVNPNPFNSRTVLNFSCGQTGKTRISVYNLSGRELLSMDVMLTTGMNRVVIDGDCLGGPGVYFVRVESGDKTAVVKLVYMP